MSYSYGWEHTDYCDEHRNPLPCNECQRLRMLREQQRMHEASVARQRMKLKIAPWRTEVSA
jgi:hypothetical protein